MLRFTVSSDFVANLRAVSQRSGEVDITLFYPKVIPDIYSHNDELQEEYLEW